MPTVYKLINPINNEIYYVGFTKKDLRTRLLNHLSSPTCKTTKNLIYKGLQPIIESLEEGENVSLFTETKWFHILLKEGVVLENKLITKEGSEFQLGNHYKNTLKVNEIITVSVKNKSTFRQGLIHYRKSFITKTLSSGKLWVGRCE